MIGIRGGRLLQGKHRCWSARNNPACFSKNKKFQSNKANPPPPPSKPSSTSQATGGGKQFKSKQEYFEYMSNVEKEMQKYTQARDRMKRGELKGASKPNNPYGGPVAALVGTSFLAAFVFLIYVGRRSARDDDFRQRYMPSWYDYTLPKPTDAWTQEELVQQIMEIRREAHERAAAGEFEPKKLEALKNRLGVSDENKSGGSLSADQRRRQQWDKLHPGLEEGEKFNEN